MSGLRIATGVHGLREQQSAKDAKGTAKAKVDLFALFASFASFADKALVPSFKWRFSAVGERA
jgi:hypothetical protein